MGITLLPAALLLFFFLRHLSDAFVSFIFGFWLRGGVRFGLIVLSACMGCRRRSGAVGVGDVLCCD